MISPLSLRLLLSGLLASATLSAAETPTKPPCCRPLAANTPLADSSLYQLESTWISDVGREIKLGVLRGRPQVVAMFFTHCEYACPILVHEMHQLEQALPPELRNDVDFLLVSFDPERDTPTALAEFRRTHELNVAHWTLLRGQPDDVRELAVLLGVNYQKDARGQFAHSNIITVLDAEGQVVQQFTGLKLPLEEVVKALRKQRPPLANEVRKP